MLREHDEELLQKHDHLLGHVVQLMQIAVSINIAEPCPYRIVHEKYVGEFVPATVIVYQLLLSITIGDNPIRPNFHHRAIHATASWPAIEPQY